MARPFLKLEAAQAGEWSEAKRVHVEWKVSRGDRGSVNKRSSVFVGPPLETACAL